MRKVLYFFSLALVVLGCFGGIGYMCYYGNYAIALGIVVLTCMAWPTIRRVYEHLIG